MGDATGNLQLISAGNCSAGNCAFHVAPAYCLQGEHSFEKLPCVAMQFFRKKCEKVIMQPRGEQGRPDRCRSWQRLAGRLNKVPCDQGAARGSTLDTANRARAWDKFHGPSGSELVLHQRPDHDKRWRCRTFLQVDARVHKRLIRDRILLQDIGGGKTDACLQVEFPQAVDIEHAP